MMLRAEALRALGSALQTVANGLLWLADVLTRGARAVLRFSRLCLDRAREWDPRLWDRGQHTDLHPPPGA